MKSLDIPPQKPFFFRGKWSAEVDDLFLATTVRVKGMLRSEVPGIPEQAIVQAGAGILAHFGYVISTAELKDRVKLLETRYKTFKAVMKTPGVWWDHTTKVVVAEDSVWVEIMKCHPFAAAYYHQDEFEYDRLANIFGLDDVKIELSEGGNEVLSKTLVIVSDGTYHYKEVINISDSDSPFSEEVNSPAMLIFEKVRRKLFDDEAEVSDRESSNMPPAHHYVLGPEGNPIKKTTIAGRKLGQLQLSFLNSSLGGSSTGSNNPFPLADLLGP